MSEALVNTVLGGRYRLAALLGKGGMGAVYEAHDLSLGRAVAVKVLLEPGSRSLAERFFREAFAAARLQHVNIVQVTDFGPERDGAPAFIVMERLAGRTLGALLAEARVPVARALRIATQTASALGAAHAAGVVHRDVKPDNLFLVDVDGLDLVKVLDFGIVKVLGESATTTGSILGTLSYMSPEQALAGVIGPPTDVWSTGVVLYQMLAGRLPIARRGHGEVVAALLRGDLVPLRSAASHVPPVVEAIVDRALDPAPERRFRDGAELAAALRHAQSFIDPAAAAPTLHAPTAAGAPREDEEASAPTASLRRPEHEETAATPPHRSRGGTLQMPQAPKRPR